MKEQEIINIKIKKICKKNNNNNNNNKIKYKTWNTFLGNNCIFKKKNILKYAYIIN